MSNVNIIGDIENNIKVDLHKQHLSIANLILDDFNRRLNLNIVINYDVEKFKFSTDITNKKANDICYRIENFIVWALQEDYEKEVRTDIFINSISNLYFEPVCSSITFPNSIGKLNNSDVDYFIFLKTDFIKTFEDYIYLPFISESCNNKIRTELNKLCKELEKLVKFK